MPPSCPQGASPGPPAASPSTQCCPSHARRRAARTPPRRGAGRAVPARRSPSPSPRLHARGPLTSLAEKRRRLFSVATEVTPLSRPGSGSYPWRTRPTSGWRLSLSSWLSLCPRDRKILRSGAHLEPGPRTASPPGRGLHRARACALGGGQSRSPGVRSRTAQPAPVPRSASPCTVRFSRAWAPQSAYRWSQPSVSPVPPCARRAQLRAGVRSPAASQIFLLGKLHLGGQHQGSRLNRPEKWKVKSEWLISFPSCALKHAFQKVPSTTSP